MQWQILTLVVAVGAANAMTLNNAHDPCARVVCRAGRECVVSGGVSQCVCVTQCPDHDKPVCGTDGKSYDNHCLLHQHACLSGEHIGIDYSGYCDEDIALALQEFGITTKRPLHSTTSATTTPAPSTTTEERLSVCYGPQRDALRDAVISHWQQNVHLQPWHTPNMTYRESLSGHFFSCDKDRDYNLRPTEMLDCFIAVPFQSRPEQDSLVTRTLCVDALIELADTNRDWKLDFQEFTHLLDPQFHPLEKHCSLEGKTYGEGAEVRVECNHCVCATGSWVCATHSCPSDSSASASTKAKHSDETFGYMDTKYDLLKNSLDSDEDDYDNDDDDYYDDDDDDDIDDANSGESSEDYKNEIAKKEYNLLSDADKKKLEHLESNIRKFYNDIDKWDSPKSKNKDVTTASLNSIQDESSDSVESEETSSEEEEDDLLDQYDDLLERSQRIRDRLQALRTSISNIEEHRRDHESENTLSTSTPDVAHSTTARPDHLNHASFNSIDHSRPVVTQSRKHEKYRQYQELLRRKQDRHRLRSQTDNDIWEDQWKAKIKKHHHQRLDNSL